MKMKNLFPNLIIFVTLAVFGLFSFPVQRTADAKFALTNGTGGPENAINEAAAVTDAGKMPADLIEIIGSDRKAGVMQDVIVQFRDGSGGKGIKAINKTSGRVKTRFADVNLLLASVPVDRIASLADDSNVIFITPDRQIKASLDSSNILVGTDKLRQPAPSSYGGKYAPVDGSGIGVAVIDSGIDVPSDSEFKRGSSNQTRVVHFKDWAGTPSGVLRSKPYDDYGHGTPVAGVVGGSGWASQQTDTAGNQMYPGNYGDFTGIAPGVNLISLRVINRSGSGSLSNAILAIDYAIANKTQFNIRVINMSFGAPVLQSYRTDPLCLAVERAVDAGIVVVASAGNHGHNDVVVGYDDNGKPIYQTVYGSISSPGNSPYAITVGAAKNPSESILKWHQEPGGNWVSDVLENPSPLRRSDIEVASFSSRGPTLVDGLIKPDVIAPGVKIVAANTRNTAELPSRLIPGTVVPNTAQGGVPKAYVQLSGTSFAAPVVSAIAALMLEANPSLTPGQVKALIMLTAQRADDTTMKHRVGAARRLLSEGAGLVNGFAAVRLAQNSRTDANLAESGESLLLPGRTLQGLNEDLKLLLTDIGTGNFIEKAVFNNGFLMANGIVISDGLLIADGMMNAEGILIADGILMADGILIADGLLIADGILIADGSLFPEGLLIADSVIESEYLTNSGSQRFMDGSAFQDAIDVADKSFYAAGVNQASGNIYGQTVFAKYGRQVWGRSVMNPASLPGGIASESTELLASEDDAPITGIGQIDNTSPYYPAPQE